MDTLLYKEIGDIFDLINSKLESKEGLSEISQILKDIDVSQTPPEVYLAYYNYTSCMKDQINEWSNFVKRLNEDLVSRGISPEELTVNYKVNMKEERTTSSKLQAICDDAVGLIFNSDDSIYDRLEALEGVADRVNMMVDKLQEKIAKETSVSNILQNYHTIK